MRLNGAAINASRLNVAGKLFPKTFSVDSVGVVASELAAIRYALSGGSAVSQTAADLAASAQRIASADFVGQVTSHIAANAVRIGSGTGVIEVGASLYYTRIVYGDGGAEIQIVAISDIGVVYGDGGGVITPDFTASGTRVRTGVGSAFATTHGDLAPSAIRIPSTTDGVPLIPWIGNLDSATITSGGVRRIDGFGSAIAYLTLEDNGFKRQVFIGSLDLEPIASGFATAVRNGTGASIITTDLIASFDTKRLAQGTGTISGHAALSGEVFVRGDGTAVIEIASAMTGFVYRRGGVMDAVSTLAAQLEGQRIVLGAGSAPLVAIMLPTGTRVTHGELSPLEMLLYGESFASDYNISGFDDDTEIFYRPASVREFAKSAFTRELRRS